MAFPVQLATSMGQFSWFYILTVCCMPYAVYRQVSEEQEYSPTVGHFQYIVVVFKPLFLNYDRQMVDKK